MVLFKLFQAPPLALWCSGVRRADGLCSQSAAGLSMWAVQQHFMLHLGPTESCSAPSVMSKGPLQPHYATVVRKGLKSSLYFVLLWVLSSCLVSVHQTCSPLHHPSWLPERVHPRLNTTPVMDCSNPANKLHSSISDSFSRARGSPERRRQDQWFIIICAL